MSKEAKSTTIRKRNQESIAQSNETHHGLNKAQKADYDKRSDMYFIIIRYSTYKYIAVQYRTFVSISCFSDFYFFFLPGFIATQNRC
jgi:hypothetical protein